MIERVISGGQTGADQAGWRAAKRFGIPTGGWMPKGFLTEDGPRPEFANLYGALEHKSPDYAPRTARNVEAADAVILFGNPYSPGGKLTMSLACGANIDFMTIASGKFCRAEEAAKWVVGGTAEDVVRSLLVAGNRESKSPGIGAWVEDYLCELFRLLGRVEREP